MHSCIVLILEAKENREEREEPNQKYYDYNPQDQRVRGRIFDTGDGLKF